MLLLTAFLAPVTLVSFQAVDLGRFEVLSDDRKDHFAGKLGFRIEETLTVKSGERQYRILLPRIRTRYPERLPRWKVGGMVAVRGRLRGSTVWAERKDVRLLALGPRRPSGTNREGK